MPPFLFTLLFAAASAAATTATVPHMTTPRATGHVTVNGIALYHEQYGPAGGTPLVVLPGGGSTIHESPPFGAQCARKDDRACRARPH